MRTNKQNLEVGGLVVIAILLLQSLSVLHFAYQAYEMSRTRLDNQTKALQDLIEKQRQISEEFDKKLLRVTVKPQVIYTQPSE